GRAGRGRRHQKSYQPSCWLAAALDIHRACGIVGAAFSHAQSRPVAAAIGEAAKRQAAAINWIAVLVNCRLRFDLVGDVVFDRWRTAFAPEASAASGARALHVARLDMFSVIIWKFAHAASTLLRIAAASCAVHLKPAV